MNLYSRAGLLCWLGFPAVLIGWAGLGQGWIRYYFWSEMTSSWRHFWPPVLMKKMTFSLRGYFSPWVNLYIVMSFHYGPKDVHFSQSFLSIHP